MCRMSLCSFLRCVESLFLATETNNQIAFFIPIGNHLPHNGYEFVNPSVLIVRKAFDVIGHCHIITWILVIVLGTIGGTGSIRPFVFIQSYGVGIVPGQGRIFELWTTVDTTRYVRESEG